jgi:hypothetical protein
MLENETETDACVRICLSPNFTQRIDLTTPVPTEIAYIEGATARTQKEKKKH